MTHWNWGNIAVNLGIGVNILATLGYVIEGDWKRVFYWASATAITIAVRII
jgi:sugar phosphate permease